MPVSSWKRTNLGASPVHSSCKTQEFLREEATLRPPRVDIFQPGPENPEQLWPRHSLKLFQWPTQHPCAARFCLTASMNRGIRKRPVSQGLCTEPSRDVLLMRILMRIILTAGSIYFILRRTGKFTDNFDPITLQPGHHHLPRCLNYTLGSLGFMTSV